MKADPYSVPCRFEYVPAAASKMPKIRCGAGVDEQCVEPFGQYVEPHAVRVRDAQRRALPTKVGCISVQKKSSAEKAPQAEKAPPP